VKQDEDESTEYKQSRRCEPIGTPAVAASHVLSTKWLIKLNSLSDLLTVDEDAGRVTIELRPSRRFAAACPAACFALLHHHPGHLAMHRFLRAAVVCLASLSLASAQADDKELKPLRAGIIGLDTSHVPAFTKIFNDPEAEGDVKGIRVVVGYPGGTDYGPSASRVEKFTQGMRDAGVEIVDTIPELLAKVDVVLLESVDARIHLEEAIPVIKAGKPVFIDKPIASSLADAIVIFELAKKHNVPLFSSSSLRFGDEVMAALQDSAGLGEIVGAQTWGPCDYQDGTPDLCFYGIHGVEALFTLMGSGVQTVSRTQTERGDVVVGTWSGDRIGTFRGIRKGSASFGGVVFGSKSIMPIKTSASYKGLCHQIGKFFRTHEAPVDAAATIEIFAFMEAADESKRQGGKPVAIADVMAKGQEAAAKKLAELEGK